MARTRIVFTFVAICILSEFVTTCGSGGGSGSTTPTTYPPGAPTNVIGTAGNARISVAFSAPVSNGGAAITSYTATCTSTTSGSSSGNASGTSSPIIVAGLTNGDPYTCTVYATNSAGNGPASAASAAVTPELPTPTLSSISPAMVSFTGRETQTFVLTGTNFPSDVVLKYSAVGNPVLNAGYAWISSTQINMSVTIDPTHFAYDSFSFDACKSDGVSCSSSVPVVFYGKTMCGVFPNGETVCANSLNGNVDFFSSTGAFENEKTLTGFFNLNACGMAVDPLTKFWSTGLQPVDQNGSQLNGPILTGYYADACVASAAGNGFIAILQPTETNGLTYGSWVGPALSDNAVIHAYAGTNPQAIAIDGNNVYVFDASKTGTPAIGKLDMTTGGTDATTTSWPTVGIAAGAPTKPWMAMFNSLGVGVIVSGNVANVFSESNLKPVTTFGNGGIISLPAGNTAVSIAAVGNYAVIGSWNGTLGTFIKLDPSTGNVTLLPYTVSFEPIGLVPNGTSGFRACPQDEASPCSSFTLP